LQATAGIDDNARDSKLVVQVQIFGDDRPLATTSVSYGKPFPIDVDLSGVLRLRIQWQITTGSRNECCPNGYLEFGNAVLLGLPGEVPSTTTTTTY
jgi:serine/threonine-protein kinase